MKLIIDSKLFVVVVCFLWSILIVDAIKLPKNFQDEYVGTISSPSDFAFTPDGRLLVLSKTGRVYVLANPDKSDKMVLALDMTNKICDNGGRGLGTVAVHPNFAKNKIIYLYWTFNKHDSCDLDDKIGPINKISQFVLEDDNKISWKSENVIFNTPELKGFRHSHGCMEFDKQGYLWVTHGDGHLKEDSDKDSHVFAKLMRLTASGGIPDGNPYKQSGDRCAKTGQTTNGNKCQEIYASGLRNPFRCAIDPNYKQSGSDNNEVRILINDVGEAQWEEISECNTEKGCAKSHFGWPTKEGPCDKGITEGKLCKPSNKYTDPIHYYQHISLVDGERGDAAVTGGTFITKDIGWPSKYDDCYFHVEYVWGIIYCTKKGNADECRDCKTPVSNYKATEFASGLNYVVSLKFGPYKTNKHALYYISRGDKEIRRIVHVGSGGNQNPVATIDADVTSGLVGLTVNFDGKYSIDPDGNNNDLQYEWDLNGDGSVDSTKVKPTYTYRHTGLYEVTLKVTDNNGGVDNTSIDIRVGTLPTPEILQPTKDAKFSVGDIFVLKGRAYDVIDLNTGEKKWLDKSTDTNNLCWEVLQHHDTHTHPWLEKTCGNNIQIDPAPEPEDFYAATNSYLNITMTAINNDGLEKYISNVIMPRSVKILFKTSPSNVGLFLRIDGTNVEVDDDNGIEITSWVNFELPIEAFYQCAEKVGTQVCYTFKSWSDGGPSLHTVDVKENNPTFVATFEEVGRGPVGPTMTPTPGPSGDDHVSSGALLIDGNVIEHGEILRFTGPGAAKGLFLKQELTGNFCLYLGTPLNPKRKIWETGFSVSSVGSTTYYTAFQKNGILKTREGSKSNKGRTRWKSRKKGLKGDWVLFYDKIYNTISIHQGTPTNLGMSIWTDKTMPLEAGRIVLLGPKESIATGQIKEHPSFFLEQKNTGELVLYRGTVKDRLYVIWTNGINKGEGEHFTRMQGNGNLMTKEGTIANKGSTVWKSRSNGEQASYYFVLDMDETVSIYQHSPTNGFKVWPGSM